MNKQIINFFLIILISTFTINGSEQFSEDPRETQLLSSKTGYTLRTWFNTLKNLANNPIESGKIKKVIINNIEDFEHQQIFLKFLNYQLIYYKRYSKTDRAMIKHLQDLKTRVFNKDFLNQPD